jgi:hypothetical protein
VHPTRRELQYAKVLEKKVWLSPLDLCDPKNSSGTDDSKRHVWLIVESVEFHGDADDSALNVGADSCYRSHHRSHVDLWMKMVDHQRYGLVRGDDKGDD